MEICCKTCKHGQGWGCEIGWCIDREEYEQIEKFIPSVHCIGRYYHYWKTKEDDFIDEKEMAL